jgi:2-amino-4-hydroxy-6-hydroxymethyldihydropteridine diphosphokinase
MILIGIGSNLDGPWGSPQETVRRAITGLYRRPLRLLKASRAIVSAPYGRTDQPDFVNAAVAIDTALEPHALLEHLHAIERSAGRQRTLHWGPRTLDLDLLDYHGLVIAGARDPDGACEGHRALVLPHPGIPDRAFVLQPIAEIAPNWHHPVLGETALTLLRRLQARPAGTGEAS